MDQKPPDQLDADLDRIVRTTGRQPIAAALGIWGSAALIVVIVRTSGGQLALAEWLAILMIVAFASPGLLAIGIDWRRRTLGWAEEEQRIRLADRLRSHELERERDDLRRQLEAATSQTEMVRPRALPPGRPTTGRHRRINGRGERP